MKRIVSILMIITIVIGLLPTTASAAGTGSSAVTSVYIATENGDEINSATLKVTPSINSSAVTFAKESMTVQVMAVLENGSAVNVSNLATCSFTDGLVAKTTDLDDRFTIQAVASGSVGFTAAYGGQSATLPITVPVYLQSLTLSASKFIAFEGKTMQAQVIGNYSDGTQKFLTDKYTFSGAGYESLITVATDGTVTGVTKGTAYLTATEKTGSNTITSVLYVYAVNGFTAPEVSVAVGERKELAVSAKIDAIGEVSYDVLSKASYVSADTSIAEVNQAGEVKGIGIGTTTVTATYMGATVDIPVTVGGTAPSMTTSSTVSTDRAVVDMNTACGDYADLVFTMNLNGNTLTSLLYNGNTVPTANYTVSGNTLTFKKEPLVAMGASAPTLTFVFSQGASCSCQIGIVNSSGMYGSGTGMDSDGNQYFFVSGYLLEVPAKDGKQRGREMVAGTPYIVAGIGGNENMGTGNNIPATTGTLDYIIGVAVDTDGNLYICGMYSLYEVAAKDGTQWGIEMKTGYLYNLYTASQNLGTKYLTSYGQETPVVTDSEGNVYFFSYAGNKLNFMAAKGGTRFGIEMKAGETYTILGGYATIGYTTDGTLATDLAVAVDGLAVDQAGNVYFTNEAHNRVHMMPKDNGVHFDKAMKAGCLYLLTGNNPIKDDYNTAYSGDGENATTAKVNYPSYTAVDKAGNVYFFDSENKIIRVIANSTELNGVAMTPGYIYTVFDRTGKDQVLSLHIMDDGDIWYYTTTGFTPLYTDTVNHPYSGNTDLASVQGVSVACSGSNDPDKPYKIGNFILGADNASIPVASILPADPTATLVIPYLTDGTNKPWTSFSKGTYHFSIKAKDGRSSYYAMTIAPSTDVPDKYDYSNPSDTKYFYNHDYSSDQLYTAFGQTFQTTIYPKARKGMATTTDPDVRTIDVDASISKVETTDLELYNDATAKLHFCGTDSTFENITTEGVSLKPGETTAVYFYITMDGVTAPYYYKLNIIKPAPATYSTFWLKTMFNRPVHFANFVDLISTTPDPNYINVHASIYVDSSVTSISAADIGLAGNQTLCFNMQDTFSGSIVLSKDGITEVRFSIFNNDWDYGDDVNDEIQEYYVYIIQKSKLLSAEAGISTVLGKTTTVDAGNGSAASPMQITVAADSSVTTIGVSDIVPTDSNLATVQFYGTDSTFAATTADSKTLIAGENKFYATVTAQDGGVLYYAITVNHTAVPTITTTTLPGGTISTAYSQTLAVTGTTPITWSLDSGSLPDGLTLAPDTGIISGTPTVNGTFNFTIKAINSLGSDTQELSIVVSAVSAANNPPTTKATVPTQSAAVSGTTSFNASAIADDADSGDTLTVTGIVTEPDSTYATASLTSGTVTITGVTAGSTSIVVTVSDGKGGTVAVTVPITVTAISDVEISITPSPVKTILNAITFGLFFNDSIDVSITSVDSGVDHYEYQLVASGGTFNTDGTWTTGNSFPISPDFKGNIYARAVYNGGTVSVTAVKALVVDTTKPVISASYDADTASIDVTVTDSSAGIDNITYQRGSDAAQQIDLEPTETRDITTTYQFTISSLPDGKYDVVINAIDNSGNVADAETVAVDRTVITDATISPTSATYDLAAPGNVSTTITWNSASSMVGVAYGAATLAADDYAVSGSTLAITSDYIGSLNLSEGDAAELTVSFDVGNPVTFTVDAVDSYIPSDNADLSGLTVNSDAVSGFDPDETGYDVELPYGTASVTVGATSDEAYSSVDITQASDLPGSATVVVTAEDTTTQKTYTIHFTIGEAPNDAPTAKSTVPTQNVTESGKASFNASNIAKDEDGDTLNIIEIVTLPDSVLATAVLSNGTVTVNGVSVGSTSIVVKVSDGTDTVNVTVPITVSASQATSSSGGGGGSSSGGSSSSGSSATTESSGITVSTDAGTTTATQTFTATTGSNGVASASVTSTQISDMIAAADKKASETNAQTALTLNVNTASGATGVSVTIPQAAASSLTDNTSALTISSSVATVTLDSAALAEIGKQTTGDITITATAADTSALSDESKSAIGSRPVYDLKITSSGAAISSFGGGTATVSIPYTPTDGEDTSKIVVYYISSSGALIMVPDCVYDATTGKVTFKTTHFSSYAVGYNDVSFTDVSVSAWYADYVSYLSARKIINGTGDGKFSPKANITRAEFVTILANLSGDDLSGYTSSSFSDVATTNWYFVAVQWASKNGIASGYDGKFNPNSNITREQMAVMLYNYAKYAGDVSNVEGMSVREFKDYGSISSWALKSIQWAMNNSIISGNSDGSFAPATNATRAQAAKMISALLQGTVN